MKIFTAPKGWIIFMLASWILIVSGPGTGSQAYSRTQKEGKMTRTKNLGTAIFAGGCFWCLESAFEGKRGVIEVVSGYTGGHAKAPSYEAVCSGTTGHAEAVRVTYDPDILSYWELLEVFFSQIDPTDATGSFVDRGSQYRSGIFFETPEQERLAHTMITRLNASGIFDRPIATEVTPASVFYPAEDYHQDYHKKNAVRYKFYRTASGRDRFIHSFWDKGNREILRKKPPVPGEPEAYTVPEAIPDDRTLKLKLSPLQYKVTRKNGTEPPFRNEYWDNKKVGIYVDIISGAPLFSSRDKFDSGTGWPSFTRPLNADAVIEREDTSFFMRRTEVRSKSSDAHLGHLFSDGPAPTGRRYCINSAALRFIPEVRLDAEGYGALKALFDREEGTSVSGPVQADQNHISQHGEI